MIIIPLLNVITCWQNGLSETGKLKTGRLK